MSYLPRLNWQIYCEVFRQAHRYRLRHFSAESVRHRRDLSWTVRLPTGVDSIGYFILRDLSCGAPPRYYVSAPLRYGRLAQWLEHSLHTRGVGGSNPSLPTISQPQVFKALGVVFWYSASLNNMS